MYPAGRVLELIRRTHHHELRAGDQVVGLENTIDTGFRHKVVMGIGDVPGQFSGRQVGSIQCHLHDQLRTESGIRFQCCLDSPALVLKTVQSILLVGRIPAIEAAAADLDLIAASAAQIARTPRPAG